jgi:ubiquinone/menaquinone biosynthesis C-methylase UbiE
VDTPKPHSADYFTDHRDHWWNDDYLALLARRFGFAALKSVLDVGCGVGHWGRTLLPHLPPSALVAGIDPEPRWVEQAAATAAARGLSDRLTYTAGSAEHIPFPDDSFDLVTCQTVLMHVPDVPAALREMLRVLRPGGRLLCAEPNNMAGALVLTSPFFDQPAQDLVRLVRFQAICQRGKRLLGKGDNSIGDALPGLFALAGLQSVEVYLNDRPSPLVPPYRGAPQQAFVAQIMEQAGRDFWIWDRPETLAYFTAGGGDPAEFELLWKHARQAMQAEADGIREGTLHGACGMIFYIVSGLKPATPRT